MIDQTFVCNFQILFDLKLVEKLKSAVKVSKGNITNDNSGVFHFLIVNSYAHIVPSMLKKSKKVNGFIRLAYLFEYREGALAFFNRRNN